MSLHPLIQLAYDNKSIIEDSWLGFAKMVIPATPHSSTQFSEMRKAYYCGFFSAFNTLELVSTGVENEDEAAKILENIQRFAEAEIFKFGHFNNLKKGGKGKMD